MWDGRIHGFDGAFVSDYNHAVFKPRRGTWRWGHWFPNNPSSEDDMAVQKSRKTPSRRGMRRSHDSLEEATLSTDPVTGELHRRHHLTADGYYRGKKLVNRKSEA